MTLQEHVANIGAKATDYNSQTILAFINMILGFAYKKNLIQTLYEDPLTGRPPLLTTRATIREYTFPENFYTRTVNGETVNVPVRKTAAIFTDYNIRSSYQWNRNTFWPTYEYKGEEFYRLHVKDYDRKESEDARIIFPIDPGDTTDRYYHLFYEDAPRLYTMNDEIYIPSQNDIYITFATLWIIKNEDYGDEKALVWIEDIVKKIQRNLSLGDGGEDELTRTQPENRRYGHGNRRRHYYE